MEVGAGDTSGFSRQGDNISLLYLVSRFDIDFVEMSVDGGEVMSVFQNDHIAGIKIEPPASVTIPSAAALTGVPIGQAMSVP